LKGDRVVIKTQSSEIREKSNNMSG